MKMDTKYLWKHVIKMDETLSSQSSSLTKDDLIQTMKQHISDMKSCLTAVSLVNNKAQDLSSHVSQANENHIQEDILDKWKVCDCGEEACTTCMAEQAAKVPPKSWSASQELSLHPTASQSRTVTERDNSLENGVQDLKKRKESIRAKRTSTESKGENVQSCQSSIPKSDYPVQGQIQQPGQDKSSHFLGFMEPIDIQRVTVLTDVHTFGTGYTSKVIYRLHRDVSASGLQSQPGQPNACGIIAVLFADKMLKAPAAQLLMQSYYPNVEYLTDEVFEMVFSSIQEGIDIYSLNFGSAKVPPQLETKEIMLLNSHLDRSIKDEQHYNFDRESGQVLVNCLMTLQVGEILLFYKMGKYKVISAICREDGRALYIFDCQRHTVIEPQTREKEEFGGFLYEVYRDCAPIVSCIVLIQKFSGENFVLGNCTIATLE